MAHFLMNALLAAGGWQWRTIEGTDQARYRDALDRAHLSCDLGPLAALIKSDLKPADGQRGASVEALVVGDEPSDRPVPQPEALAIEPVVAPVIEPVVEPVIEPVTLVETGMPSTDPIEPSTSDSDPAAAAAAPVPSSPSRKRKRQYAPMPTQMGLFGE